jgi:hypothetical protein
MKKTEETEVEQKKVGFKQRIQNAKIWVKNKLKKANDFFEKNPEAIGSLVMVLGGAIISIFTFAKSAANAEEEKCRVQDGDTSACWVTKSPLTNEDWLKITELMDSEGISLGQALNKLGYLRK